MTSETKDQGELAVPTASVAPVGRRSWAWLLPLLAALLALVLAYQAWGARGLAVTIRADDGHGIKTGHALRYRGIQVGSVERVGLSEDLSDVILRVRLEPGAEAIARAGSRFWIVRPHVSLDSVQGIETVVGARYLAVLPGPGDANRQTEFVALREPPVGERIEPGGVEVTLEATERFSLTPGAPLTYRQIQVGSVLSVGLSSDATAVEVRAYIRPAYAQLVRERTRFWEVGGVEVKLTLMGGLEVHFESLRSMLVGGIALATPPDAGGAVSTGHRFVLHDDAEQEWLEWEPALAVGSSVLPLGTPRPHALRASLTWRKGRLLKRKDSRQGWVLPVPGGVVGPIDLLQLDERALADSTSFEVAGKRFTELVAPTWSAHGLARVELAIDSEERWLAENNRALGDVEDCLVFTDPATPPWALSSGRVEPAAEGGWRVDDAVAFDARWHGGCVLARSDGKLIGMLLVEKGGARIAPLNP